MTAAIQNNNTAIKIAQLLDELAEGEPVKADQLRKIIAENGAAALREALQQPGAHSLTISNYLSTLNDEHFIKLALLSQEQDFDIAAKQLAINPSKRGIHRSIKKKLRTHGAAFNHTSFPIFKLSILLNYLSTLVKALQIIFIKPAKSTAGSQAPSSNRAEQAEQATNRINAARQTRQIPSVSVAIVHQGQIIHTAAYGERQVKTDDARALAANSQTTYRIDSLTKQFTASAIMKLVEQGKVALDVPIKQYIPTLSADWDQVTARHLINHTAGLPYQIRGEYPSIDEQDSASLSANYLARLLEHKPQVGKHIYSNIGYELLGLIIKNASGQSYGEFMNNTFFTPLGMTRTTINANVDNTENFAIGYNIQDNMPAPVNHLPSILNEDIPLAAAGILSTAEDLAKWELALQSDFFSEESKKVLWGSHRGDQGAWNVGRNDRGEAQISAAGVGWGYNSAIIRFPERQTAVIVLANLDGSRGSNANIPELALEIAQCYQFT